MSAKNAENTSHFKEPEIDMPSTNVDKVQDTNVLTVIIRVNKVQQCILTFEDNILVRMSAFLILENLNSKFLFLCDFFPLIIALQFKLYF